MVGSAQRLVLDARVRRSRDGRTLVGGSPLRIVRLTERGREVLDALLEGAARDGRGEALARRLLDAGLAHPRPDAGPWSAADVCVVVPVRDRPAALADVLGALGPVVRAGGDVVVVDDGSDDAGAHAEIGAVHGAHLIRHEVARGPGAARNTGWQATIRPVVAFVDSDCVPEPGWIDRLLRHFADPDVALVAPRIVTRGSTALERYESAASPLDLGTDEGPVGPGRQIPYVPSAALVVRRDDLEAAGGFSSDLRVGEDVDLVWRLVAAGRAVRFDPSVVVDHPARPSWSAMARQRVTYGRSAAALEARHPGAVRPIALSPWSAAVWALVASGGRRRVALGVALAAGSTAALAAKLRGRVDRPAVEALRLAGAGHLHAGQSVAAAARRSWWPLLVVLAGTRRGRRVGAIALVTPPIVEWLRRRPPLDPARWLGARTVDDSAYGLGVWRGCLEQRSFRSLLPRIAGVGRFR